MSLRDLAGVSVLGGGTPHDPRGSAWEPGARVNPQTPGTPSPSQRATLPTAVVQQGLAVFAGREPAVPDPGTVDGDWGARTEQSLSAWGVASGLITPGSEVTVSPGGSTVTISIGAAQALATAARQYVPPQVRAGEPARTAITPERFDPAADTTTTLAAGRTWELSSPRSWPWWLWLVVLAAAAGGSYGMYYWWQRRKRRR